MQERSEESGNEEVGNCPCSVRDKNLRDRGRSRVVKSGNGREGRLVQAHIGSGIVAPGQHQLWQAHINCVGDRAHDGAVSCLEQALTHQIIEEDINHYNLAAAEHKHRNGVGRWSEAHA